MSSKILYKQLQCLGLSPQFIQFPGCGERLVVLSEAQYRMLERMAAEHLNPVGTESEGCHLPNDLRQRIATGENPVRAIRKWRGMTARKLALLVEITPSMMSQIERTGKTGSTRTFQKIAMVLGVPLEDVVPHIAEISLCMSGEDRLVRQVTGASSVPPRPPRRNRPTSLGGASFRSSSAS